MNFILYEDDNEFINCYQEAITKVMLNSKVDYEVLKINNYDEYSNKKLKNIIGNKIYILDIEVPGKNGLDLAREIRKGGDWTSPIIIVTSHEEFKTVGFTGKILMLDFITKNDNVMGSLIDALSVALEITCGKPIYKFSYKGQYYSIPLDEIIYFEKSLNDNNSIIVCENDEYVVRKTISSIALELENTSFFKTHRSCIVNINKILKIDYDRGIIFFKDSETNLLSRSNKKKLMEKMSCKNVSSF